MLIIIAATLYAFSRFADFYTSRRAPFYETHESNKLFRKSNGDFSSVAYILVSLGLGVGIAAMALKIDYLWTLFLPFALGSFLAAWTNYNQQKKNRVEQTAFLQNIHVQLLAGATLNDVMPLFNNLLESSDSGQTWFPMFAWIKVADGPDATLTLITNVVELARGDESTWFPE